MTNTDQERSDYLERVKRSLSYENSLNEMTAKGIPPNRENLISYLMNGEVGKWGADNEARLPEHLQDWEAFEKGPYNEEYGPYHDNE